MFIRRITLVESEGYDLDVGPESVGESFKANLTDASYSDSEGALELKVSGGTDVNVTFDVSADAPSTEDFSKLFIRYMIPVGNSEESYASCVYFTTSDDRSYSESKAVYGNLTADGLYHTLILDLSEKETWSGDIVSLRFDYFQSKCSDGDVIYIESISLK